MSLINKTCCFFGHRTISGRETLLKLLIEQIEYLIVNYNVDTFLFGEYGEFDNLCKMAVERLKQDYPYIKTVFVQAYYDYNRREYFEYKRSCYNEIIYPELEQYPQKFRIVYRNQAMIEMSDYCIFYVKRKWGGAYDALRCAKRKNKNIYNFAVFSLFDTLISIL